MPSGNLFAQVPEQLAQEQLTKLLSTPNLTIERIVSRGHASPPDFWYDQDLAEWIVVLAGSAGLLLEDEPAARVLRPGDYIHIPAHLRHRVEWTDRNEPTIWLAIHYA